jgi:hypothetical protein
LDVVIALGEALITLFFVIPSIIEASSTLLQTAPETVLVQLGRCVSEASKLEDVLECHGEHFWTVCPPSASAKAHVIGSIKVRVVESANEQMVLRNVQRVFAEKKAFTIDLTIQVEKRSLIEGGSSGSSIGSGFQQSISPTVTNVTQQPESTIISIGVPDIESTRSESPQKSPQMPTTTVSIASTNDDLTGDGLGLYVNETEYEDDDMFGKLKKSGSGTNLYGGAMRQRDHGVKQVFSLTTSTNFPRVPSSTTIDSKSISPHPVDDLNEVVRSSSPSVSLINQQTTQESTSKEE